MRIKVVVCCAGQEKVVEFDIPDRDEVTVQAIPIEADSGVSVLYFDAAEWAVNEAGKRRAENPLLGE